MALQNISQEYINITDAEDGNLTEVTSNADTSNLSVHPVILSITLASTSWILFANTVILICYIVNRKKVWPVFVVQIMCLSLSDLFVGIAALPWIVVPLLKPDSQMPYILCATKLYLVLSSQCGTLYHILAICAYRCFRIVTSTQINKERNRCRIPVCSAVCSWAISFMICALPFILWPHPNQEMFSCYINKIFSNRKTAMGFIMCCLLLPQILTNILYVVSCVRLRSLSRRIFPPRTDISVIQTTAQNDRSSVNNRDTTRYSRVYFQKERRFMGTIGLVMALFNICTFPLMLLVFVEYNSHQTQRNIRYFVCVLFIMNSAFNPFVYALRSVWLKDAFKRLYSSLFTCCS